jgi:hypothetical protein
MADAVMRKLASRIASSRIGVEEFMSVVMDGSPAVIAARGLVRR